VLDEIFGNPTALAIAEHTTDTAGQTVATFAIFDLAGLQFSPRIRDIGRLQLYRLGPGSSWRSRYPHAGPLLTQPIQTPADCRSLERSAAAGRVDEIRTHHRQPAHRQAARQQPTELSRPSATGIRPTRPHHLPISYVESVGGDDEHLPPA